MKNPTSHRHWMLLGFVMMALVLAACERPAPAPDTLPTPTGVPAATIPVILPTAPPATAVPPEAQPTPEPTIPPAPEPTTVSPAPGNNQGQTVHIVAPGDTLYNVSLRYGVSVEEIMAANNLTNPNALTIGQQLTIPAPGTVAQPPVPGSEQTHLVSRGENLFRIGLQYGCTVDQLSAYNNIPYPYTIYVGDQIRIPADC